MSSDTLSAALPSLRPHTTAPTSVIYTHLAHLLTRYSTGLSLPITLDSLNSLDSLDYVKSSSLEATIISTHTNPTIHLLKTSNSYHAHYSASTLPTLPPTTTILLPPSQSSPDALSLARRLLPHHISHATLPTQNIAIRLPFPNPLPLPHPPETYTLANIWRNRDLTPAAVYATLISTHPPTSTLTLIDQPPHSPSVTLTLSLPRSNLPAMLPLPSRLLVTRPAVNPTAHSFTLSDTPQTLIFYQPLPENNPRKRPRPHPSEDLLHTPAELPVPEPSHPALTVHARVQAVQPGPPPVLTLDGVRIAVPDAQYQPGDELLLSRVIYAETHKRWVARTVTNLSTMQGVLHCPFVRNVVSIAHAVSLCAADAYATAHLRVIVKNVVKDGHKLNSPISTLVVVDAVKHAEGACGHVCVSDRGCAQLLAARNIESVVWLMTVTCGHAALPLLTACVRAGAW